MCVGEIVVIVGGTGSAFPSDIAVDLSHRMLFYGRCFRTSLVVCGMSHLTTELAACRARLRGPGRSGERIWCPGWGRSDQWGVVVQAAVLTLRASATTVRTSRATGGATTLPIIRRCWSRVPRSGYPEGNPIPAASSEGPSIRERTARAVLRGLCCAGTGRCTPAGRAGERIVQVLLQQSSQGGLIPGARRELLEPVGHDKQVMVSTCGHGVQRSGQGPGCGLATPPRIGTMNASALPSSRTCLLRPRRTRLTVLAACTRVRDSTVSVGMLKSTAATLGARAAPADHR